MTVSVRAFTERIGAKPPSSRTFGDDPGASAWTLIFDTETTTDQRQALRFGFYQLREHDALRESGAFFNPDEMSKAEITLLRQFAKNRRLELLTVREFLDKVFLGVAYGLGAAYVGFNLPFDLSRLAVGHSSAQPSRNNHSMVGGFSFRFSEDRYKPRIQVKHLNSRCSLIRFTLPREAQQTPGAMRRRNIYNADRRGHFIDLRSFASALLSGSWSLKTLADFLRTEHRKLGTEEHGGKLTAEYLEYGWQDVQASWECYVELTRRYRILALRTKPEKIISEASLGKAYLDQMGIRPWTRLQPEFPRRILGAVMSSYYGGRAEVHARRIAVRVMYCDFLSMYPTVCVLMKLWRFVIASGLVTKDATAWTTDFLEAVTVEDLRKPETWRKLTILVRVQPDADVFPVRAKYDGENRSIGLNILSSERPMWFTLADCIASKLLTGKAPEVLEAIAFRPGEPQDGLCSVNIAGNPEYGVDPVADDFFKRTIELRTTVKTRQKKANADENERLESEQQALKICANATSYGIFVELNPNSHSRPVEQLCYGSADDSFEVGTTTVEEPGKFFNPILGTLITGAARLMLALSERVGMDRGLTWAFCDTDGIAFTPAPSTTDEDLIEAVTDVRQWFKPLSPYEGSPDILKLEDENFRLSGDKMTDEHEPLVCFAISAKRYALFNRGNDGSVVLRKATAHGLGHLMAPYDDEHGPTNLPKPVLNLRKLGLKRWHCDLWHCVVTSGLSEAPEQVDLSLLAGMDKPAVSKYAATSTDLLDWFKRYNDGKDYGQQVRPFGFMLSFQPRKELGSGAVPRASAPYDRDPLKGVAACFDRETGESITADRLMTVRESLLRFHLHREAKFLGGDFRERGFTRRRHVRAVAIEHIGKEANRWEDSFAVGEALTEELAYGESPQEADARLKETIETCRKCNRRQLASLSGVCLREVTRVLTGKVNPQTETLGKLEQAAMAILDKKSVP